MSFKFNPFTGKFDWVSVEDLSGYVPYTKADIDYLTPATAALTYQPIGNYESPLTFSSPLSRTVNVISFLFNTDNSWTGTNIFTKDVIFQGNTAAQIILNTNGNNTVYSSAIAFRRLVGGGLGIDSPASVIVNLDSDNNTTTARFMVRADAIVNSIFYVSENITTGGVGVGVSIPIVTLGADTAGNYYNNVSALIYAQNYSLTTTGDNIPNLMAMWFYTQYNSGFNSGKIVAEGCGLGGIHYMAGATGTVLLGEAIIGWIWSSSGNLVDGKNFVARSKVEGVGTYIANLYGYYVENLIVGTGSPTLPAAHYGFYCENLTQGTNNYGIYLENFTDTINDWAIYSAGGRSAHAGKIRIGGTSVPIYECDVTGEVNATVGYRINGVAGVSGSFITADAKTVTVTNGIITVIA